MKYENLPNLCLLKKAYEQKVRKNLRLFVFITLLLFFIFDFKLSDFMLHDFIHIIFFISKMFLKVHYLNEKVIFSHFLSYQRNIRSIKLF